MAIISTTEYKAWAGITASGFDTRLDIIIPATQAVLEEYCGRVFDETTYTDRVYDGNGELSIWLEHTPVSAVSSVKLLGSDGTTTTLSASSYRWLTTGEIYRFDGADNRWDYPSGFVNDRDSVWSDAAPGNVLVSFTGGFSTMPADLKYLMYKLVDAVIDGAGDSWENGSTSDGVESKSLLSPADLEKRYADLVRPWKRVLA